MASSSGNVADPDNHYLCKGCRMFLAAALEAVSGDEEAA
jgi:hypothetical protein